MSLPVRSMNRDQAEALPECRCNGTGQIHWQESPGQPHRIGDVTVQAMTAFGSSLCPCRKALPPREGQAAWWSTESVYAATVAVPVGNEAVEISVSAEVPISRDNYRVVRRGNRYYPTLIDVEAPSEMTLHPDTARELAQRLIAAADAADLIDQADADVCGHWAPCDCGAKPS